jgi:vitamin B12 transporter
MRARQVFLIISLLILASLASCPDDVVALEQDETLNLLGQPLVEDKVAGRIPRQLSHTAENTTVITSSEIEALNAHTLIDILSTIPGVQLENQIGSANAVYTRIQGSNYSHVLVLLDGIPYINLGDNYSDIGQIPARIIDRVEIVKGAASSAWGQALGGVINIITKSPDTDRKIGGMAIAAHGESKSNDVGGELTGTIDRFGYYLSGGYLGSNGFRPNTGFNSSNAHVKFSLDLPDQGRIGLLLNYVRHDRGDLAFTPFDYQSKDEARRLVLGLTLLKPLGNNLELKLDGFHSDNQIGVITATLSDNLPLQTVTNDERTSGAGVKLLWRLSNNLLTTGIDYQHARIHSNDALVQTDILNRHADRYGFYLNDTYTLGPTAVSAGMRYDLTGSSGNQFSPSFGITWRLGESTILRGYTAKGFSLPAFTVNQGSERVWTSQVGIETSAIPNLWLKGTLFRNDTWDILKYDSTSNTFQKERQIKQGVELEARSTEFLNTSFRSGYSYVDARHSEDNSVVRDVPTNTLHIGVRYDDHKYFKALVTGRHIFWNSESFRNGMYRGLLWDLHLNATPFSGDFKGFELFFSLRNIFNGSQYQDEIYRNNGRWAEGGMRFRF